MKIQQQEVLQQAFNQTRKGIVMDVIEEGLILVQDKADVNAVYPCYFLRTAAGALPKIKSNDTVIYRVPELDEEYGVVLGIIEKYMTFDDKVANKLKKREISQMTTLEDKVLHIKADDGLVIECGKSSIILTKDGKIQIKGNDLLSRARGMNKIKGAGVNIN
ncbi:MAG: hypothetical protein OEX07_02640 [Gammaproteobacteria bacterium]|nr:hypothetical protein [Gammaproteobacteria bacterium]